MHIQSLTLENIEVNRPHFFGSSCKLSGASYRSETASGFGATLQSILNRLRTLRALPVHDALVYDPLTHRRASLLQLARL